ncbi:MAG: CARDB domain-containing protein [Dehalococcoidales bacterium]|nr:CARDB domain-containing protein [Dehalococcoidales bacterium]
MAITGTASVSVPSTAEEGTTGTITISVSSSNIGAFELYIQCSSSSVIRFDSISAGNISNTPITTNLNSQNSAIVNGFSTTGSTGGTAATITFTVIGSAGSSTDIQISGSMNEPTAGFPVIDTTFNDGSIAIVAPPVQHTLTMATVGQGSTSPSVGNHTYNEGQTVSISANPSNGWRFDHWEGDAANPNSASTSVTINSDKTVTAVFVQIPTYTLSIAINGEGSVDPATGNYSIQENETVSLSATPADGWRFIGWTGGVTDPDSATTTVVMNENKNITANFAPRDSFALTVNIEGSGSTTPQEGTHTYSRDAEVEVTANPAQGYKFDSWLGDVSDPNSATTTVVIDDDKEITARFVEIPAYTLTIEVSGNGTTEPAPGAHQYLEGTEVNITATPADGWRFIGWTGNVGDPDSAATTITITADTTVTANFVEGPPPPPRFTNIDVLLTTRNEAVITWNTDLPAAGKVIYWEDGNSQKETPLETDISTRHVVLLEDLEPGKTYNYSILAVDDYGNEVASPQNSLATTYTEAAFKITGWNSDISIEEDGRQVTINVTVANSGDLPGGYELVLKVNGTTKESQTVNLEPGGTETVTFNVLLETPGSYDLDINGFKLGIEIPQAAEKPTVTVTTPAPGQIDPDSPSLKNWLKANWQIVFGVVMGIILLILIIILILHRYYYIVTFIRR